MMHGQRLPAQRQGTRFENADNYKETQSVVSSIRPTTEKDPNNKWRPRHRMESQTGGPTSYRAAPGFGLDKGRDKGTNLGFAVGRGRATVTGRGSLIGSGLGAYDGVPGGMNTSACMFRYPRGKLLDLYRKQKPELSLGKIPVEMEDVGTITQVDLVEPVAFIAPDAEEEASLNGISKGKITSSEVHTSSGEKSLGEESLGLLDSHAGGLESASSVSGLNSVASEAARSALAKSSVLDGGEPVVGLFDQNDMGKVQQSDFEVDQSEGPLPPEEFTFMYIDPQGVIQGPFIGPDIISWFEQGFFGTDLQVRLSSAPEGTPFQNLGSIMSYLKMESVQSNELAVAGATPKENPETGLSILPGAEHNDTSSITGMARNHPLAQDNFHRNPESEVYAKPPNAEGRSYLDFSAQNEVINSSTSMRDALAELSAIHGESTEAATRNQNDNKLHPFGVLWSELESNVTPIDRLPNRSYSGMGEPTGLADNWPIDSRRNTEIDPNMSLNALAVNQMSQFDHVSNRFNIPDQLPSNQHHQQLFQNRGMISHSHMGEQAQDLEHLIALQLQQQQKIQLQQQHKIQLQQRQKAQLQQQQMEQEHQYHRKLLQEQQQSHARQLHLQQILQGHNPDSRFGQSHDFHRSNSVDKMLLEQQLMNELQMSSGHQSRNSAPFLEQLAAGNFGQLPHEDHQRELLLEQLLATQMQPQYGQIQSQYRQHGQLQSDPVRSLEYQLLQHEQLLQQEQLMQQEQMMQLASGVRRNTLMEKERHIDPLWPSDHNDQLLRSHQGVHRSHSSTGFRPQDFNQLRPPYEDRHEQLERNLSYQQQLRQELFEQGLPFERSSSLPRNASGLNLDSVNGLGLSQSLEAHMQSSGRLGNSTIGFNHQNPGLPLGEPHFSQLEQMEGRWSRAADTQLAGDWAESQFRRSNIDAEQHHKMRSEIRRMGGDSNSLMVDGPTDDKLDQHFMGLLHQRPDHQSAELQSMNHGEAYDRMAPSGHNPRSNSLMQTLGGLRDHDGSLNASSTYGRQVLSDEQVSGLPGLLHNDDGRSAQNETQAFRNKEANDIKSWNNLPPKNVGTERMSFEAQDRMAKQGALVQGELPVTSFGQQSSFNRSDPYNDNLIREDRRKDRLLVPSHGQDIVLLKRTPSSHSSSSHEGLLEHMPDTASRIASSYDGARRESGGLGNKGSVSEASFSEMLKKSSTMKKVAEPSADVTEGKQGGGGKKKGKKGRQIDPALLGFKVTSNRILMGEIHRSDDF